MSKNEKYTAPSYAEFAQWYVQLSDFGKNVLRQIAISLIVEEKMYIECTKSSSNIIMLKCNANKTT
ncbi:MAG: hypothetical protein K2J72_08760 [Oscillospiraceae bacterium]|nr:hypothetical protein [Oscillospiraceae bacterium]